MKYTKCILYPYKLYAAQIKHFFNSRISVNNDKVEGLLAKVKSLKDDCFSIVEYDIY